jgi:DNA-binding MarR family transcriptional regulator
VIKVRELDYEKALSGAFAMLWALRNEEPRISVAEVLAVMAVAMATRTNRANLASVRDVAEKIGLTASGASRVLSNLSDPHGLNLVSSDRSVPGTRAEGYVLTEKGRALVAQMLAALTNWSASEFKRQAFETHTLESYAKARWIDKFSSAELRRVKWDEKTCTLIVAPCQVALSKEIQEWAAEYLSKKPKFKRSEDGDAAAVTFNTLTDAVYFTLRWC